MRMLKLARLAAHRAKLGDKSAVALENLQREKVTLGQMLVLVKDNAQSMIKGGDALEKDKDLNPVVFFVADIDESQ